jgi:type IV fimbrial biogenesis protein FimT
MRRVNASGFTIVEMMIALAISGVLVAVAVPSFQSTIARARLEGAVNVLAVDLQYARSESIGRRSTATLTVNTGGASYTLAYVDPSSASTVTLKTVTLPTDVSISATGAVTFSSLRGLSDAQTFTIASSRTSEQLQVLTNASGRVRTCSPSGSFKGYPTC